MVALKQSLTNTSPSPSVDREGRRVGVAPLGRTYKRVDGIGSIPSRPREERKTTMEERRAPWLLHFDGGGARERKVRLVGCALDDEQFIHHTSRSSFTDQGSTPEATPCPLARGTMGG
eukprot:scaffold1222_cov317-Pavlova_lutheri.AAC.33